MVQDEGATCDLPTDLSKPLDDECHLCVVVLLLVMENVERVRDDQSDVFYFLDTPDQGLTCIRISNSPGLGTSSNELDAVLDLGWVDAQARGESMEVPECEIGTLFVQVDDFASLRHTEVS